MSNVCIVTVLPYDSAFEGFDKLVYFETVIECDIAHACPSESRKVCAAAESLAYVACQGSDICAFAAHDTYFQYRLLKSQYL